MRAGPVAPCARVFDLSFVVHLVAHARIARKLGKCIESAVELGLFGFGSANLVKLYFAGME